MIRKLMLGASLAAMLVVAGGVAHAKPTAAQKCASSLRICCGKYFLGATKCNAKGALIGGTDPVCINAAVTKFDTCTSVALGKGGCITDQAGVDHLKDEILNSWATDVVADTPSE